MALKGSGSPILAKMAKAEMPSPEQQEAMFRRFGDLRVDFWKKALKHESSRKILADAIDHRHSNCHNTDGLPDFRAAIVADSYGCGKLREAALAALPITGKAAMRRLLGEISKLRATLIDSNIRLVIKVAAGFPSGDMEDLVGDGVFGLIRAVESYDLAFGTRFSTHAFPWIKQAISRSRNANRSIIRMPEHLWLKVAAVTRARHYLSKVLNREPTVEEIAERSGVPANVVDCIYFAINEPKSLDAPVFRSAEDGALVDMISSQSANAEDAEQARTAAVAVAELLSKLDGKYLDIIRRRFGIGTEEETLLEIGPSYGVTRERIRQMEQLALKILRHKAGTMNLKLEDF